MRHPLGIIQPKSLKHLSIHLQDLIRGRLWLKILLALGFGLLTGILLSPTFALIPRGTALLIASWLAVPGKIFLGLIQMIVVPLVFASVIMGLASSEDMEQLKKLGSRLLIYFIITTVIAISIGISVGLIIKPGNFIDSGQITESLRNPDLTKDQEDADTVGFNQIPDLITNILPENPLGSMVKQEMLQVVLFAVIIGLALVALAPDQSRPLLDLLNSIQEVCMTVVRWAMLLAPVAVYGLIAQIAMQVGLDALLGMAVYVGTVLAGLFILLIFYLLLITFIAGKSPRWFLRNIREVQLLAFSTSSSAAVMPLSLKTAEEKLKVRAAVSQFLIPLGATINMDGTALYQGVATVFLAQVFDVQLTLPALLLVIVTAVGASIGSPATPGVGIVILSMVLNSVGIPPGGIALIIGVDRILDMSRTAVNVTGDLTASLVMEKMLK
ncbi:MAG: dicarboxylate/amino acid:cation symporter [Peptococcaceae bacterium]